MKAVLFLFSLAALAAAIVSLSLLSSWIQQQIAHQRGRSGDDQYAADKEGQETHQQKGARIAALDIEARIGAISDAIDAYHRKRDAHEHGRSKREQVTIYVLFGTALFAALAAVASGISDWIFYRQLDIMSDDQRAWVAPAGGVITDMARGQGIKMKVYYQNTGKEPATRIYLRALPKDYSESEWNNGTAASTMIAFEKNCLDFRNDDGTGTRAAYPTSNGIYYWTEDTAGPDFLPNFKVTATDDILSGGHIFAFMGCFIYASGIAVHHSAFCYFYHAGETTPTQLGTCSVGNDAD